MGAAASIGTRSLNLPAPDSLGQWPASQTTYGTGDFGGQKTSGSIDPDAINKQFRSKAEADAGAFLGNLMKTGVGGAMEELGIGDWLPDFTQTPLMRSIAGGLEAFKGPLQGALEGKLGIQQPGWQPGMPVKALTEGGGDTTSGGGGGLPLFGLPNIELPPPPEGTAASGVGTGPPPGPVQNIDMSINYNDSTIGEDPAAHAAHNLPTQEKGIAKLPMFPGN